MEPEAAAVGVAVRNAEIVLAAFRAGRLDCVGVHDAVGISLHTTFPDVAGTIEELYRRSWRT